MSRTHLLAAAIVCALPATALGNAQFIIINANDPGVGFNDPTPVAPVGGNPGTTVGEQRLLAFQFAADRWGELLDSAVPIRIIAAFESLPCGILGQAGANTIHANFPGAPHQETWFSGALANKLAGFDLDPVEPEIFAVFNSEVGNPACGPSFWYYGLDNNEGPNGVDLIPVLMHEFGHGLGFQSFVNTSTGVLLTDPDEGVPRPDPYLLNLFDNQTAKLWRNMTDAERAASARNPRHLVWNGANILADAADFLTPGTPFLAVTAPAPIARRMLVGEAAFGPRLDEVPISGRVRQTRDTAGLLNGCAPYAPDTFAVRRIALIDRGVCGFAIKVKNAQNAGALAVIIADNAAGTPPAGLGGADPTITIPSIRITQADGNAIKDQLVTGVDVSLALDLTIPAGADAALRPLLFSPDPVQGGSSVSHFDPSTTPNTLMEPAINADLTARVDLALPLFRDIGWYADADVDLVPDGSDNCIGVRNPNQLDTDGDRVGDACDDDDDADGAADVADNCPLVPNPDQVNTDGDDFGNACDDDDDNDGALDAADNCALAPNADQADRNDDGAGDVCDDEDGDGRNDAVDNCADAPNADQANADGDALGDACDPDDDNDGRLDGADNCPLVANPGQENSDTDADGDACDGDADGDGDDNAADNCPLIANPEQEDFDGDQQGDACDADDDNDGALDGVDNCALLPNAGQENADDDALGDACDADDDNDGTADAADNCALVPNAGQENSDSDAAGDACDADDDNDTIPDTEDNCELASNFGQENADGDADGDACDADDDNDGDLDAVDNCVLVANLDQLDTDGDAAGDACDIDDDADGVLDTADNCALTKNIGQENSDNDANGNACDEDDDNDSKVDAADNCPLIANTDQADKDHDGVGDACDLLDNDDDGDHDGGGCCSTGKQNTPPLGALLLGFAVAVSLRRRRRS